MCAIAPESARAQLTLQLLGAHNALNALAGLAVALEAGVDLEAAVAALEIARPRATSAAK